MAAVALRFRKTGNAQLDQLQRELAATLQVLLGSPFATGKAIRGTSFVGSAPTVLTHGLGYAPVNVIPLLVTGGEASFYVSARTPSTITVVPSITCSADFWVS